ncbi:MAG: response regulator transcription factor [Flavobacteriaceae bacterium]
MIKLIITEDNLISQKALVEKISAYDDILIKEIAQNGQQTIEILEQNHNVDLILMDIEMPVMNGIQATEIIKSKFPQIKIVMITIHDDDDNIFNAIKAGADSYLLKESKSEKIYETIQETLLGGSVMSPSIAMKTLKLLKNPPLPKTDPTETKLSERETEVLEQLSKGLKNSIIADNLYISPFTVKGHIQNIYKKLQAHNRIELVQIARKNRLI